MEDTVGTAPRKKRDGWLRTGYKNHTGELDVESKKVRGVYGAGSVERQPPTKKAVPDSCLSLAEIVQLMVSTEAQQEDENITQLSSEAISDG